jgi:hypothetical protein
MPTASGMRRTIVPIAGDTIRSAIATIVQATKGSIDRTDRATRTGTITAPGFARDTTRVTATAQGAAGKSALGFGAWDLGFGIYPYVSV